MPRYDYKCSECHNITERIEHWSVKLISCPKCMGGLAEQQLSYPGGIKVDGKMVLSEAQRKMIKEPVWEDPTTGAIESAW